MRLAPARLPVRQFQHRCDQLTSAPRALIVLASDLWEAVKKLPEGQLCLSLRVHRVLPIRSLDQEIRPFTGGDARRSSLKGNVPCRLLALGYYGVCWLLQSRPASLPTR